MQGMNINIHQDADKYIFNKKQKDRISIGL